MSAGRFPLLHARSARHAEAPAGRRRVLQVLIPGVVATVLGSSPAWARPTGAADASPASTRFWTNFEGLKLQDQDGRRVQPERWAGRTVLINFVYTGCSTVCPVQTRALADLHSQLPRDLQAKVQLLSISLDPLSDTPQALKAFARKMGADRPGWTFATGRPEDIGKLSDALRLFRPGTDVRKPEDHSTALWLIDGQGQLRLRYSGNPPDVPRLLREVPLIDKLSPRPN